MIATAERRFERAQDVPIAISAFSEADLEKRGVTTNDGSQNRSSPIAMYVDDVRDVAALCRDLVRRVASITPPVPFGVE